MDTPAQEPGAPLDEYQAAALLSSTFDEPKKQEEQPVDTEIETQPEPKAEEAEQSVDAEPADDTVEVEVDGKPVKLTKAELAEAVKGQMRQSDYTKKTMELAEQRKATAAEAEQHRAERTQYKQNLQLLQAQAYAGLQEQQKIDWDALKASDPVEFVNQVRIAQERQAALANSQAELQRVAQAEQAEAQETKRQNLAREQQDLLAKLPEWKDEGKAKAEQAAIAKYLVDFGYSKEDVDAVADHRAVILARKAMLYDQMLSKASAAQKKVENLPKRVERPSVSDASPQLDRRNAAYQRLSRSGKVEDAASLLSKFL